MISSPRCESSTRNSARSVISGQLGTAAVSPIDVPLDVSMLSVAGDQNQRRCKSRLDLEEILFLCVVCFTVEDLTNSRTDDSEFGSCAWGVKVQETEEMKWKRKYGKDRRGSKKTRVASVYDQSVPCC